MESLREKAERHITLPELFDLLGLDYEDIWELSLSDIFSEYRGEIKEILEDYGD